MSELPDFSQIEGFEWDRANFQKNWQRHRAAFYEGEEVFFHEAAILPDPCHSVTEARYFALGRTIQGRWLTVVFTMRKNRIRVISARDMSRKEKRDYGQIQTNP